MHIVIGYSFLAALKKLYLSVFKVFHAAILPGVAFFKVNLGHRAHGVAQFVFTTHLCAL
jgi:hypothetical protein